MPFYEITQDSLMRSHWRIEAENEEAALTELGKEHWEGEEQVRRTAKTIREIPKPPGWVSKEK